MHQHRRNRMKHLDIMYTCKEKTSRLYLREAERAPLPAQPPGLRDLSDE